MINLLSLHHKLIVTIIKKGLASKVVKATKNEGAEGGTILFGKGTGIHEHSSFMGIPIEPEKEIILTLTPENQVDDILSVINGAGKLDKPGNGVGFVINVSKLLGKPHLLDQQVENLVDKEKVMDNNHQLFNLIVTIVNKGNSETVVNATKGAGAEGGTILFGRGTGIHEHAKLFSIQIEPEKEVVLTLVPKDLTDDVLLAIEEGVEINKPGKGIAFVLDVERTTGINHNIIKKLKQDIQGAT